MITNDILSGDFERRKAQIAKGIIQVPENMLEKGGPGSNKEGRTIGQTRSGKPILVLREAHGYKDFDPVDHLEAYKCHMAHATKVGGVAAINSQIRAHDHAQQAKIKTAQKELEEIETKNVDGKKKKEGDAKKKEAAKQKKATGGAGATLKIKVEKALEDILGTDIDNAFNKIIK